MNSSLNSEHAPPLTDAAEAGPSDHERREPRYPRLAEIGRKAIRGAGLIGIMGISLLAGAEVHGLHQEHAGFEEVLDDINPLAVTSMMTGVGLAKALNYKRRSK